MKGNKADLAQRLQAALDAEEFSIPGMAAVPAVAEPAAESSSAEASAVRMFGMVVNLCLSHFCGRFRCSIYILALCHNCVQLFS